MFRILVLMLLLNGNDTVHITDKSYATRAACERDRAVMQAYPLTEKELRRFVLCVPS